MIDESNPDHAYMFILNRGGLSIPSLALTEHACSPFAILNFTENMIKKSTVPSRKAAVELLNTGDKQRRLGPRALKTGEW